MNSKLIIYQLENNKEDYPLIRTQITSYSKWAKIMDRCWIIKSNKSSSEVRNELSLSIANRGKIFVIDVTEISAWGSYDVDKKVTDWLKENL
jgi:hypothetical protein